MEFQNQIKVATSKGMVKVAATNFDKRMPYLAVTMTTFGSFEVTHRPTGKMLVGAFERAVNACVAMVTLQLALNELDIDSSGDTEKFLAEIKKKDKECQVLNMSLMQWIGINRTLGAVTGEFPWETSEEGPHAELELLHKRLNGDGKDE